MCDKAILKNCRTLKSVPHYYKNKKMCNKTVGNYAYALEFLPDCYKTQKICNKAVKIFPLQCISFLNAIKLKKLKFGPE